MADDTQGTPLSSKQDTEKLERVQEVLEGLKDDARKAHDENDLFMLSVYNDLLAVASPIVVKAHARIERESRAAFNKAEKEKRRIEQERRKTERDARRGQRAS